jgi:hypothetical protein
VARSKKDIVMNEKLANEFEEGMRNLYRTIVTETKYRPTALRQMIDHYGGVTAAKRLIYSVVPSDGYTKLWELNRLDLTVEAFVLANPQWHSLFTEPELTKAAVRLKSFRK